MRNDGSLGAISEIRFIDIRIAPRPLSTKHVEEWSHNRTTG